MSFSRFFTSCVSRATSPLVRYPARARGEWGSGARGYDVRGLRVWELGGLGFGVSGFSIDDVELRIKDSGLELEFEVLGFRG